MGKYDGFVGVGRNGNDIAVPQGVHLGGETREATILFADIRDFTSLSEQLGENELLEMLNEYFTRINVCIQQYHGTIDKFIGDAVMGIFLGLILLGIDSVFTSMVMVFSMVMVMTAVALISDFTSVLLDTTDNAILLPRPIDSRTMATARITHIVIYILMITLALTTASIIIGTIKFGPIFTVVFIFTLFFAVLFIVFLLSN